MAAVPRTSIIAPPVPATPQVNVVVATVFLVFMGQMTLNPVVAPLSRDLGLAEWQIGLVISTAAITIVLTSRSWGRRSQQWGRKPILVGATIAGLLATALFAVLAQLGVNGVLTGGLLFALLIVSRGILLGLAAAAVPPTAQAYIAEVTVDERTRIRGLSRMGAAQSIAMIMGAALGGALAGISLMVSIAAVPVIMLAAVILTSVVLRREPRTELIVHPRPVRPFDPRVLPFLLAGFGMFTALGFMQIITGFIVQDRYSLNSSMTGLVTGASLLMSGLGMAIAQTVIVPRSGWRPPKLLRVGSIVAFVGLSVLIVDGPLWLLLTSILCIGFGLGIGIPGYTAGASLMVERDEQGGLAGLIGATNGLTFVLAPTASTFLYAWWPPLPVIVGACIMAVVAVFVQVHPRLRRIRKA